jgi:hypothetical protein
MATASVGLSGPLAGDDSGGLGRVALEDWGGKGELKQHGNVIGTNRSNRWVERDRYREKCQRMTE